MLSRLNLFALSLLLCGSLGAQVLYEHKTVILPKKVRIIYIGGYREHTNTVVVESARLKFKDVVETQTFFFVCRQQKMNMTKNSTKM